MRVVAGACNPNVYISCTGEKNRRPHKWCAGFVLVEKPTIDSLNAIERLYQAAEILVCPSVAKNIDRVKRPTSDYFEPGKG